MNTAETVVDNNLAFEVAFGEAANGAIPSNEEKSVKEEIKQNAEVEQKVSTVETEVVGEETKGKEPSGTVTTTPSTETTTVPQIDLATQAELERLRAENASLKATTTKDELKPETVVPETVVPETPKPFELSEDAKKALKAVEDEWPEIAQAFKIKEEQAEANKKVFEHTVIERAKKMIEEALAPFQQQLQPIIQNAQQTEADKFRNTVSAVHADATTILPEVEKWIETLPRHKQIGANYVLDSGTAQEVIDLFTEYKQVKGITTTKPTEPTPQKDTSRLKSMEVISTRRSATTTGTIDETDFSGAFSAAANS